VSLRSRAGEGTVAEVTLPLANQAAATASDAVPSFPSSSQWT
jgi:hypothetical protein